jgi:hypothetical protein
MSGVAGRPNRPAGRAPAVIRPTGEGTITIRVTDDGVDPQEVQVVARPPTPES